MLCVTLFSTAPPGCQPAKSDAVAQATARPLVTRERLAELLEILDRTLARRRAERRTAA